MMMMVVVVVVMMVMMMMTHPAAHQQVLWPGVMTTTWGTDTVTRGTDQWD